MKANNLQVSILKGTHFRNPLTGKFQMKRALLYSARIGGICYNEDGLMASFHEPRKITEKRLKSTTDNEHYSVYEHVNVTLYIKGFSKIFNMVMNNQNQYATSERSLRYTAIQEDTSGLSPKEIELYNKWLGILGGVIEEKHPDFSAKKKKTLAQENARYMTSVFVKTEMVHTLPLAQLNRIVSYMKAYIAKPDKDYLEQRLSQEFVEFISQLDKLHLLDDRLQHNGKNRKLSIFESDIESINNQHGAAVARVSKASFACYAQKQRHRSEDFCLERNPENGFFVPKILDDKPELREEWLKDINSVADKVPQGEIVTFLESASLRNYILMVGERNCFQAQFETYENTVNAIEDISDGMIKDNHPWAKRLIPYRGRMRCGAGFKCKRPCGHANEPNRDI